MSVESSLELNVIKNEIQRYCACSLGKKMIDEAKPSYHALIIRRDCQRMKEALACTVQYGAMPFSGIQDLSTMLKNASKHRILTVQDLLDEIHFIRGIREIHQYERAIENPHPYLAELVDSLVIHEKVEKFLSSCINDYGEVMDSASSELREIRRGLRQVEHEIESVVSRFLSSHSASVIDGIVTYRNHRALVLVKASEKNTFGGLVYGDSASGQASYIEPASFVGVNNRKQELLSKEKDEIHRILELCSKEVSAIAFEELANLDTLAILDSLFAKAQWGKDRDAIVADLVEQKEIEIKKARHPLIDPEKVISNNYHLCDPQRMLLITGPNTGGKTVSMKIIGLFVLMTYAGIPITAEVAKIPFFDHVFVDIGDDQSVVSSLSSFSAHIQKISDVLQKATEDSLALLDEIGSGTDPREGESLAIAVLNELRERKCMTVATTHYGRLKSYGKRHKDILLASVQFDMEKLVPTYRFIEGMTGQSNAFEVAEKYGLPKEMIKYARFLKNQAKSSEDELIDKLEKQLNETHILKEKLLQQEILLKEKEDELEKSKQIFINEKDIWLQNSKNEAQKLLDEARLEADEILKEMRLKQETAKYHEVLKVRQKLLREEIEDDIVEIEKEFAVGDVVEIRSSGQIARINEIRKKDIVLLVNGRTVRVKESQIRPSTKILPTKRNRTSVTIHSGGLLSSMPLEVNLIGKRADEALESMSAYMDQAKLHHLKSFRIIHGDGTGKLRKVVHAQLDKDSNVDSYRIGMPQEGGTGATVVIMKD